MTGFPSPSLYKSGWAVIFRHLHFKSLFVGAPGWLAWFSVPHLISVLSLRVGSSSPALHTEPTWKQINKCLSQRLLFGTWVSHTGHTPQLGGAASGLNFTIIPNIGDQWSDQNTSRFQRSEQCQTRDVSFPVTSRGTLSIFLEPPGKNHASRGSTAWGPETHDQYLGEKKGSFYL